MSHEIQVNLGLFAYAMSQTVVGASDISFSSPSFASGPLLLSPTVINLPPGKWAVTTYISVLPTSGVATFAWQDSLNNPVGSMSAPLVIAYITSGADQHSYEYVQFIDTPIILAIHFRQTSGGQTVMDSNTYVSVERLI